MGLLADQFSALERFAGKWGRATERERWAERLASSMEELHTFYDAILPRVPEAMAYCDRYPLEDMPDEAVNLLRSVYSFVIVSFPVELWAQQWVPDTRGTAFERICEPTP
jgi:hypothetical protein